LTLIPSSFLGKERWAFVFWGYQFFKITGKLTSLKYQGSKADLTPLFYGCLLVSVFFSLSSDLRPLKKGVVNGKKEKEADFVKNLTDSP
jgi:hypothetical protein